MHSSSGNSEVLAVVFSVIVLAVVVALVMAQLLLPFVPLEVRVVLALVVIELSW